MNVLEHRFVLFEAAGESNIDFYRKRCLQCGAVEKWQRQWRTTYGATGGPYKEPAAPLRIEGPDEPCPGPRYYRDETTSEWRASPETDAFIKDIADVCKKHGLSIGTVIGSDWTPAIGPYDEGDIDGLYSAYIFSAKQ